MGTAGGTGLNNSKAHVRDVSLQNAQQACEILDALLSLEAGVLGVPDHSTILRSPEPSGTRQRTVTVKAEVPLTPGEPNSLAPRENQLRNRPSPGAHSHTWYMPPAQPCWLLLGVHTDSLMGFTVRAASSGLNCATCA